MVTVHKIHQFTGHKSSIYALVYLQATNTLVSAGTDGYVVSWHIPTTPTFQESIGKVIAKIDGSIYALHAIVEKNYLIIGHNTDGIHGIDLTTNQEIFSVGFTKSAIFDITHLGNDLLIACGDGNVISIDLETVALKNVLSFSSHHARCMAVCPQRNEIAIGYSDNHIRIFDSRTYLQKYDFEAHANSIFTLTYSPTGQYLLSGSRDAHLKIWQPEIMYTLQQDIVAHLFTINHILYNPNGDFFATCSKDKSIKLWRSVDFTLLKVIDKGRHAGHGTSINKLVWLDSMTLASCSDDTTIVIWQIELS